MVRLVPIRFRIENCFSGQTDLACSGRQMRNGLFAINMIVWVFIIIAFSYLA